MHYVTTVISLAGGLGLFLYGMRLMSDSIEKVAGAKLRDILEVLTKNRFMGLLVGIVFTAIIQSSSATTVMVVSFVNAGLMSLYQAVGVIFGANIGTTVTSQIVAFNLSDYAPIFVLIGAVLLMQKHPSIKKVGEVIIGFGALFVGMGMMSSAMQDLREAPAVVSVLSSLDLPALALIVGILFTCVLQSSSVTVSVILVMALQGLVPVESTLFFILGCNIGASMPAFLTSLSGNKDARRTALIYIILNVVGAIVIGIILSVAMNPVMNALMALSGGNTGRAVANANTLFKIFQCVLLLPFTKQIVWLTYKLVPGEDHKANRQELKYINEHYILTPPTAVPQVVRELNRMGVIARENLNLAVDALLTGDEKKAEQVFSVEKTIDYLNHEITQYLVKANQISLPVDDRKMLGALFHVVSDIERIGDHAENIAEDAIVRKDMGFSFSENGDMEIREMVSMVDDILELSLDMFSNRTMAHLQEILDLERDIDEKERELQNNHIRRLNAGECTAQAGMMFSDLASNLERIGDHATNIAFSILDDDPEKDKGPKFLMDFDSV